MSSSHETIDVRQDGRRVFVTLDRPEVLNAPSLDAGWFPFGRSS
jgi:hypothetical protein